MEKVSLLRPLLSHPDRQRVHDWGHEKDTPVAQRAEGKRARSQLGVLRGHAFLISRGSGPGGE